MADLELPDVPALRVLEAPPGGLVRLRARLDPGARDGRWWRWLALPVAAALVVLVWLAIPRHPQAPAAASLMSDRTIGGDFYWVAAAPSVPSRAIVDIASVSITP